MERKIKLNSREISILTIALKHCKADATKEADELEAKGSVSLAEYDRELVRDIEALAKRLEDERW